MCSYITIVFFFQECREEIKLIVGHISKLKYQLQTDKPFEIFFGNGMLLYAKNQKNINLFNILSPLEPDKVLWNKFIGTLAADSSSFFRASWLYAECYMYRKVSSFFENTKTLKTYDYFAKQKSRDLKLDCVLNVAKIIADLKKDQRTFVNLLKVSCDYECFYFIIENTFSSLIYSLIYGVTNVIYH